MNNEQGKRKKHIVCPTKTCEDIKIFVPVEVRAHANVGDIALKCKGHHIVKKQEKPQYVSKFEIVQDISAQIPVEFITEVEVKDERVDFDIKECK